MTPEELIGKEALAKLEKHYELVEKPKPVVRLMPMEGEYFFIDRFFTDSDEWCGTDTDWRNLETGNAFQTLNPLRIF